MDLLHPHTAAALGITFRLDPSDPEVFPRMSLAMFDLYGTPTIQRGLPLGMGFMS